MTLAEIKIFPFEKNKYYIVLFDPEFVNVESIENICCVEDFETFQGIFIPVKDVEIGMKTIEFESKEAIKEWLNQL